MVEAIIKNELEKKEKAIQSDSIKKDKNNTFSKIKNIKYMQ